MTQALFGDPFFPSSGGSLDSSRTTGMPYSSPFATQGRLWTPIEVRYLFRSCRFYFLLNPLINAVCTKMAVYPITEILVKSQDKEIRYFYENYYKEDIDLHTNLIEMGLDFNVYGNALASLFFPFKKYLQCSSCKKRELADTATFDFSSGDFTLHCKYCQTTAVATATDEYIRDQKGIRIVRWNPEDFTVHYNEVTGERLYQWQMPHTLRYDILMGKRHVVSRVPQKFIWAVKENKPLLFNPDKIFHMKRPSISARSLGRAWGVPMILPVLEDVFYLQVLRKAQEQIATEHLVPLRVLFPQGTNPGDQPYNFLNLSQWKDQVQEEISRWRRDRNYVPVLPVPMGNQTVAGDGRALLLHQEIRVISEHIVSGMGVPNEFCFGGLSYSGSSLSMRMLENTMLNYRQEHLRYLRWLTKQVSAYMGWPVVELQLKDFRMADDLNRRQYLFNLWQSQLLCEQDLMEESGFDASEQRQKRLLEEKAKFAEQERQLLAQTDAQIKAQDRQMKAQMRQQQEQMMAQQSQMMMGGGMPQDHSMMGGGDMLQQQAGSPLNQNQGVPNPQDGGGQEPSLVAAAQQIAAQLAGLPIQERQTEIARLRNQNPALVELVMQYLSQMPAPTQVMNLPEQLPPRRGPESALV